MSLSPAASLTLANLRYDAHLLELRVALGLLPVLNRAAAILPPSVRFEAAPGDDAVLDVDGGEGSSTVLSGTVRSVRHGLQGITVTLGDAGAMLAALRPAATYEKQNGKDVIRALAGDADAPVGTLSVDLPLAAYVAHQGQTAAEHVAALARLAGGIAHVDAGGALNVVTRPDRPDVALRYGREFLTYATRARQLPPRQLVAAGNGPAGAADAPDALRHSLDPLPSGAPSPGPGALWQAQPVLRTPGAAQTATDALTAETGASRQELLANCFLLPALRPGQVLEVHELPGGPAAGPWLITGVRHVLRPKAGGRTVVSAVAAGDGGFGDLLGAALGALGSLF
jgi:hypothetical protein